MSDNLNRILSATSELFYKFGIRSVTMDDIAKHLGISKKTIYCCFSDKDLLVTRFMHEKLKEYHHDFESITVQSANAIDEIIHTMHHLGKIFGQINPNFIYDIRKHHPVAWKEFKTFRDKQITGMVEKNLRKGIEEGLYRDDLNVKIMAKLRIESVELAFNPEIFPPDKFELKDVQLQLLDHFLHGIVTLKGHKLINKFKQIKDED